LLQEDPDGFFLMVEGGRIDHAAHENDPATHLHEVLAYEAAVQAALEFAQRTGSTLVVATSDHETGGVTLGRDIDGRAYYEWDPSVLVPVQASADVIARHFADESTSAEELLATYAGIKELDEREEALVEPLA